MKKFLPSAAVFMFLMAANLYAQMNLGGAITHAAREVEKVLPQKSMVAVLNFASPSKAFSDYVIEELTGELVNGKKVTIVDRSNLALITQEMNLQLSGDVSDESAQAIGKILGAQSIISGTLTNMGTSHRFRIRVINVESAAIQTQVSLDLKNDTQVAFLLGNSQAVSADPSTPAQPAAQEAAKPAAPAIQGTMVPGKSLAEKLAWLQRSADSHNTYIVEVNANENIAPHKLEYSNGINITVVLKGDNTNRTIKLQSHGVMFTVHSNVTFILDNNITLQGHSGNTEALVYVYGGTFKMNPGSTIFGNNGVGVYLGTENYPSASGTFTMDGGTISDNSNSGVWIENGSFSMSGGTISGNRSNGVSVSSYESFTMTGGTISGNTSSNGGGVWVDHYGSFTMKGGTITSNTARENGGGVYVREFGKFIKTGGIITGYNSDQSNGNVVRDEAGVLARRGHAVSASTSKKRRETTVGSGVNLSYDGGTASGGWDN